MLFVSLQRHFVKLSSQLIYRKWAASSIIHTAVGRLSSCVVDNHSPQLTSGDLPNITDKTDVDSLHRDL